MGTGLGSGGQTSGRHRLESWKEIANYFGREVRTVQRWERKEKLPVRRVTHEKGATVYAETRELEAWWKARQQAPPRSWSFSGTYVLLVMGVLVVGALLYLTWWRRTASARTRLSMPVPIARVLAESTSEGRHPRTFAVPQQPGSISLSADGKRLYVAGLNWLAAFDPDSGREIQRIAIAGEPVDVVASPDNRRIYVGETEGVVWVVDAQTFTARSIAANGSIRDLAPTPDGSTLYIAAVQQGLKKLNTATGQIGTINTSACPTHVAVTPDGQRLIVSYECGGPEGRAGHDSIEIFALPEEKPVKTISGLPNVGGWIAVSPDGSQFWESANDACFNPSYDHIGCPAVPARVVHVVRLSDYALVKSILFSTDAGEPAFLPDGSRVLLAGASQTEVVNAINFQAEEAIAKPHQLSLGSPKPVIDAARLRAYDLMAAPPQVVVYDLTPGARAELPGLKARWPADGTPADVHFGDAALLHEGVSFGPGKIGQAFHFDGRKGFIEVPPLEMYTGLDGSFALDFWVKFDAGSKDHPMMILDDRQSLQLMRAAGKIVVCWEAKTHQTCGVPGSVLLASDAAVAPATWHHIALSRAIDTLSLYIDGRLQSTRSAVDLPLGTALITLGSRAGKSDFLAGSLDEIEWYIRALSPQEVAALYRGR